MIKFKLILLFAFLLHPVFVIGQKIEYNKLQLPGLSFFSEKSQIIAELGNPEKIIEPNYDCGFLSKDSQGMPFFQLHYGNVIFTGNEKYLIEKIDFRGKKSTELHYGEFVLNSETTIEEIEGIFGEFEPRKSRFNKLDREVFLNGIFSLNGKPTLADDGIILTFRNGMLIRFDYWSPC